MRLILAVRAGVFYIGYSLLTAWFGITSVLFGPFLPEHKRGPYVLRWNSCVIWWLRVVCGVSHKVTGLEHIPEEPVVVLSKHSSQWETIYLQLLFQPLATIMKRELLNIPGFGWGLKLLRPIAIDRSNPRDAMRQLLQQGAERIGSGMSVLVFPEGTRKSAQEQPKYARGGAALGIKAGVALIPVAHNAAKHWPAQGWLKFPGEITVAIGPSISTVEGDARELTEAARDWIEEELTRLP